MHGTKPIPGGYMALDPQARAVLDQMAKTGGPPINELSVNEAREASAALAVMQGVPESVASIENQILPGPGGAIPVRIYGTTHK
jgi:acetyl esterase